MDARVNQLGYLGFEVEDVPAWEAFATSILGMEVVERSPEGGIALRMDQHAQRILISPGPANDLAFMGWETKSHTELDAIVGRLKDAGIAVREGGAAQMASRKVERIFLLEDPAGNPLELVSGVKSASTPVEPSRITEGYVADGLGLGHLVVTSLDYRLRSTGHQNGP